MRGFTLIEIMIAVTIMTILSAVGLTSFNFSLMKSRDSQRKSDLSLLAKAVHQFANDFGDYPADDGSGGILGCNASEGAVLVKCVPPSQFSVYVNGAQEIYLSKTPTDPNGSYKYYYRKNTNGFSLFSILENSNDANYNTDAGPGILCGVSENCNYD
jgi:prepilin-type N-terminal cleavage/methylation domain-containing protein